LLLSRLSRDRISALFGYYKATAIVASHVRYLASSSASRLSTGPAKLAADICACQGLASNTNQAKMHVFQVYVVLLDNDSVRHAGPFKVVNNLIAINFIVI